MVEMSAKGRVRFRLSEHLLSSLLHLPDHVTLVDTWMPYDEGRGTIEFCVESDEFPGADSSLVPLVTPTITTHPERYTWNWNLP